MNKKHAFLYSCIAGLAFIACSKNKDVSLPAGSVFIHQLSDTDTLPAEVSLAKDSAIVFSWQAMLNSPATSRHRVTFQADTTLLGNYITKYGEAVLLPADNYFFFRPNVTIDPGASLSDSAQLNIVQQVSKDLDPYTTYVLPVTIRSVDGTAGNIAPDQVLYLVAKTGKASHIGKSKWKIVSVSSQYSVAFYPVENLLDNDVNTPWVSDLALTLPQNVVIDFGSEIIFSGINFQTPSSFSTNGGYPTQVEIELSADGTNWTDQGIFDGFTGSGPQIIDIGLSSARYMRFTVLAGAPYAGIYSIAVIGDIFLIP